MENAGGHVADLSYDDVQIEYLPPNTTSLIQPMDQGIICAFKALYTRNALQHLVEAVDLDQDFSLKCKLCDNVENVNDSFEKIYKECKAGLWGLNI
uniref:DDE-1 domain-containing protein n=1 Tax=Poecilia reticulata TaxID=8081 RepID=A0A3P9PAK4_POERE